MANPPIVRSCAADNNRACARLRHPEPGPQHASQCRDPDPRRPADEAVRHFEAAFRFETDCWDTHEALSQQADPGFVLLDVRSPENYAQGHVPGALSLPRRKIIASRMRLAIRSRHAVRDVLRGAALQRRGPCRGRARARLGYPVKIMAGGIAGWMDEGFPLGGTRRFDAAVTANTAGKDRRNTAARSGLPALELLMYAAAPGTARPSATALAQASKEIADHERG